MLNNVTIPSLAASVFPSAFKAVTIKHSKVDKIAPNAFSGLTIEKINFEGVTIHRIERGAFSDSAAISELRFSFCNISSMSQKSVVAGVSTFLLLNSEIKSIAKHGAVNALVANIEIIGNRFKTLGTESLQFVKWDSVIIANNTFDFMEHGALNAIKSPSKKQEANFSFIGNHIGHANIHALITQIPTEVKLVVENNSFGKKCDCNMMRYLKGITKATNLSSPFQDLLDPLANTSSCTLGRRTRPCFPSSSPLALFSQFSSLFCPLVPTLNCLAEESAEVEEKFDLPGNQTNLVTVYDEFVLLFQVKTTKGILLFLLFCVLTSIVTVTICVAAVWIHRLCRRAKMSKDNRSGSFQFNSGEEKQVLYGSDQTTCSMGEEEPQYAEIAELHQPPKNSPGHGTLAAWVTLPHCSPFHSSTMETTLPSVPSSTLPIRAEGRLLPSLPSDPSGDSSDVMDALGQESTSLLSGSLETTQISRLSFSETSLTDEIMLALKEKLNDPSLYMSVADAKQKENMVLNIPLKEEELYCSPLYADPLIQ